MNSKKFCDPQTLEQHFHFFVEQHFNANREKKTMAIQP